MGAEKEDQPLASSVLPTWTFWTGPGSPPLLGKSAAMQALFQSVIRGAKLLRTVLVEGPSGTGKELIAKAVHAHSTRKDFPLLSINCAAIPELLFESQMFGYERGAFSGADHARAGLVELAHGKMLFLDEIGEMTLSNQAKLLRFMSTGEFLPVGGQVPRRSDVLIIAATNRDLLQLVREGKFREDLYYRLKVLYLWIPPLRDRMEDFDLLVGQFLNDAAQQVRKPAPKLTPEAIKFLSTYSWPGNVRELEHLMQILVAFSDQDPIDLEMVKLRLSAFTTGCAPEGDFINDREGIEKQAIVAAISMFRGNKCRAARHLNIDRTTLYRRMKRYKLRS